MGSSSKGEDNDDDIDPSSSSGTEESSLKISGRIVDSNSLIIGQVKAKYTRDDVRLGLVIDLPNNFPLTPPTVNFTEQLNVDKAKARRWQLNITRILASSDATICDAILDWKSNIDKQFEGIEECPVCYCVVHAVTRALPEKRCMQCNNRFHAACLYKWFESSGNSTCPLCRNLF
uniref:E3 ubiquitin-protein ligase listerin n=1 Tax=Lotharella globosa TaxID=91324 RepID=A0A7S4E0M3_9EUKA